MQWQRNLLSCAVVWFRVPTQTAEAYKNDGFSNIYSFFQYTNIWIIKTIDSASAQSVYLQSNFV